MKRWCYFVGCFLIILGCKNQPDKSSTLAQTDSLNESEKSEATRTEDEVHASKKDEDSIRTEYEISDSITLIRKKYIHGEAQYAFIVHNKRTVFHDGFKGMFRDFEASELRVYEETYASQQNKYKDSLLAPLDSYKDLVAEWIPVYSYKGDFYVYWSCGFSPVRQLTDTAWVEYYMDGPSPRLVLNVERDANEVRMKITSDLLRFKLVDASRSIYLFSDGDPYNDQYIIPLNRINEFPIIVEHCTEDGVRLIGFDRVRYDEHK